MEALKSGRLNTGRKIDDGREFHKAGVAGKKEAPQRASLGFPTSTQNWCESRALLVQRGRRNGGGMERPIPSSTFHCSTYRRGLVRQRHVAEIVGQES